MILSMIRHRFGFTLIELLIAVVIIGILAAIGLGQFHTAQIRSRDAQRKENLSSVAKALEMYYNDHGRYPDNLVWGSSLEDDDGQGTIYIKDLPNDPSAGANYFYQTDEESAGYYKLYAYIEHGSDRCFAEGGQCLEDGYSDTDCGSGRLCRYCLASPNASCDDE
ncbi:MAG: prepilin-type N-terminal cleavage/methylation domain-containing protein [Candidatus Shapirobacteria bacterium]|nr:prepilin-type N-terminal cleavage/methylation domain-containing protein [Candidatus Shapirobacteria bacterium]